MSNTLEGRVYIVTGASRGYGFAIASALVEAGAKVGITGRSRETIEAAAKKLGTENALGVVAEVTDEQAVAAAYKQIKEHFGRLDGVVNNAGVARPGAADTQIATEVREQVETNFVGTVLSCKAAIPLLRGGDNPRIVNVSSASTVHFEEAAHISIYSASKIAVERYSRELRNELQADGIGVTILRPGAAPTEFSAGWDRERYRKSLEEWYTQGDFTSMGMEPSHVAAAVVWSLMSPPGVSVDLLEIRPSIRIAKPSIEMILGE